MSLIFYPGIGVGDLKFGALEKEVLQADEFIYDPSLSKSPMQKNKSYFNDKLGVRIDFENEHLITISCYKSIILKDMEVIGEEIKEIKKLFAGVNMSRDNEKIIIDGQFQSIFYIEEFGLSIWVDRFNIVQSVDCYCI